MESFPGVPPALSPFLSLRRKRSHEQMIEGPRRGPRYHDHWDTVRHPHWNRNFIFDPPMPPHNMSAQPQRPNTHPVRRHIGDGLDYRRPVMSQPAENVIDLTSEASSPSEQSPGPFRPPFHMPTSRRAPQSTRRIIDLGESDDDEMPPLQRIRNRPAREPSPEIEFLHSRPRPPGTHPRSLTTIGSDDRARNVARSTATMVERAMEGIRGRIGAFMPQAPVPTPTLAPAGVGTHIHTQHPHHYHHLNHDRHHHHHRHAHQVPNGLDVQLLNDHTLDLAQLQNLDFTAPGFNLGTVPQARSSPPPRPTYEPPPPARPGYTRTLGEDQVGVCPNCDDELGTGDNEVKRQVWVVRSCGHVYCGDCAKHRTKAKSKERTTDAKPFKKCVVEGCGQKSIIHSTAMIQCYL